MRHAGIADRPARMGAIDRLTHGIFHADTFHDGIGLDATGQPADFGDALFAAFGAHLFRREHGHQPDRSVADDGHGHAGLHVGGVAGEIAPPADAGHGQKRGDQVFVGMPVRRHQRAVGQRHASERCLRAGHEFALLAGRLETEMAMRAGIVGQNEAADDEPVRPCPMLRICMS